MKRFNFFNIAIPLSLGIALGQILTLKGVVILIGLLLAIFGWTAGMLIFSKGQEWK